MELEYIEQCPECKGRNLTMDNGRAELVCNRCGYVLDDGIIDQGPEWRAFDAEQVRMKSRAGAPLTYMMHDKGLTTHIDKKNLDATGRMIPARSRAQLYRLRKWQNRIRVMNPRERNLAQALVELNKISSRLELPRSVRETAALIYRKAVDKGLIRGRSIEGVVAASIYAACRQCRVPRTLDEIALASAVNRKEVGRTYRYVMRMLGLHHAPTTPMDYVPRIASLLNLNREVQSKAMEILRKAIELQLTSGRGPVGTCASAIYVASVLLGERRTQKEIAEAAEVTEVTIRNRYKELVEKLDIEITL
jgi:transcription initiation factor TFIIB